jgi:hypothetical protein
VLISITDSVTVSMRHNPTIVSRKTITQTKRAVCFLDEDRVGCMSRVIIMNAANEAGGLLFSDSLQLSHDCIPYDDDDRK